MKTYNSKKLLFLVKKQKIIVIKNIKRELFIITSITHTHTRARARARTHTHTHTHTLTLYIYTYIPRLNRLAAPMFCG